MFARGLAITTLLAAVALAGAAPRRDVSLNGQWEYRLAEELTAPPREGQWRRCVVPGYLRGVDYQRAWFRRSFVVPQAFAGQRIKLRFGGVKYDSRVYVNGRHVGGCFGGYQPFEADVTDVVHSGRPNELVVGCHDWTGIFTPGKVDFGKRREWHRVRGIPRDKILAPIGGLYGLYGIWDDVTLRSHPAVYVKDLFIKPSVRRRELVVDYILANESEADGEVVLTAAVEDKGRDILHLPKTRVRVPAGKTATTTVRTRWPNPHLWSYVDPYLYHLRTELSTGETRGRDPPPTSDTVRIRFGFREFWVEGPDFYLNGSKIHLLASSGWPPHAPKSREEMAQFWRALKKCGCVAFRTHTQPWRSDWYDVADEVGILIIVEGAVWNDDYVYRINDPVFWDNYARHLHAMIRRDKNHPSVIMWSLENELYGGRMNDDSPAKKDLIRMGRLVRKWDPTRPFFYESDGDPGRVADVIGIHYPHEYPHYTCWPNEAHWLAKPKRIGHRFHNGETEFFWRKRKPLYIGEFLWLPSRDPSWHTVFFGDDAYIDYRRYRNRGKAECWKMQILGYRHHGVSGICPWTVVEGGRLDESNVLWQAHKHAYQPIAAYCHDYDRRFYAGEKVSRRVEVFNHILKPSKLTLAWTLSRDGNTVAEGSEKVELGPAGQQMLQITVPMPDADRRTPVLWRVTLDRDGRRVFDETHHYAVFPRPTLPKVAARIGLYDPKGSTRQLFEAHGFRTEPVESLARFDHGLAVLVIGAGAFEERPKAPPLIGRVAPEREALQRFVALGGRLLVLEQTAYPEGLFDLNLTAHHSTMTFPQWPSHPALRGVERDDLKFWRGDHLVTAKEPSRPASGAALPLVVSGSAAGLDHAPLLERPMGGGYAFFSQLKLVEKFDTEPTAARILANLLEHLATRRSATPKTGVIGASREYLAYLRSLGLRVEDLTGRLDKVLHPSYFAIICRGETQEFDGLRKYLAQGGDLLVHRYPPKAFPRLARELGLDLELRPYAGTVTRAEGDASRSIVGRAECDVPLLEILTREDLYWLDKHSGIGWAETPRATGVADAVVALPIDPKQATAYEVEDWKLEGGIVERRPPGVVFATVGTATGEIEFPETGTYILGLVASGTPCGGVYPIANVSIDGEALGTVYVEGRELRTHTVFGTIEKGRHTVAIAFTNDANIPPEDRNLVVDRLLVQRKETPGLFFLTSPPAVAVARSGRGHVILDQLKWDTEQRNARKAARYVCSLLSALGADFTPRPGVAIECEAMTPKPDMPWYRNHGTWVYMGSNGHIKGPIEVAAAGRYTMEVVAGGMACEDVFPHIEAAIDGRKVGEVQLTGGGWRPYPLAVKLTEGAHVLTLTFTNDKHVPGVGDVNLHLDKVVFYKE